MKDIYSWPVPEELAQLELYAKDAKLCVKFRVLMRGWQMAFPRINLLREITQAHSWELANPTKQKRNKARFLNAWLKRAYEQKAEAGRLGHRQAKADTPIACEMCHGTGMKPTKIERKVVRWGKEVTETESGFELCPH